MQLSVISGFVYLGLSLSQRCFNMRYFQLLISIGFINQCGIIYIKMVKLEDLRNQIEPIYAKELEAYEKFYHEEGVEK